MSDRLDLLLWSTLALALGVVYFALARGDLGCFGWLRSTRANLKRFAGALAAEWDLHRRARPQLPTPAAAEPPKPEVQLPATVAQPPDAVAQQPSPEVQPPQLPPLVVTALEPPTLRMRRVTRPRPKAKAPAKLSPTKKPSRLRPAPAPLIRLARKSDQCRHPIVLAHGWMAVDAFSLAGMRHEYFRGVREHLREHGQRVYISRVSPFANVRRRAEQLAEQLASIDAEKINIIAHSMGGLDARYAISRLGLAERVASLTTIGTPHRGTPLADASAILRDLPLLQRALRSQLGLDLDALHDLTTRQMAEFNDTVPNASGVRYTSYVGCVRGGVRDVHTLLAPGFAYLNRRTGDNDGMVPTASQRWGNVEGEIRADHWAQIGWSQGLDVKTFYARVARALAGWGF